MLAWPPRFSCARPAFSKKNAAPLARTHIAAFCLMGFWIVPLMYNLPDTTRFNILWIFQGWGQAWRQVFPPMLRPFGVLALLGFAAWPWIRQRGAPHGLLGFLILLGLGMYFAGYRARVVDVRFLPFFQFFLMLAAVPALEAVPWTRMRAWIRVVGGLIFVLAALLWIQHNTTVVTGWIRGNYQGWEKTDLWQPFKAVNDFLAKCPSVPGACPRVVYEHSAVHQRAGTVRAFESLPLFSGRSTLEGVYIQASLTSPFIFYIQSQISQRPSTPIPEHVYSRFQPEAALPRLDLFNVSQIVAVEKPTVAALQAHPAFTEVFAARPYHVFDIRGATGRYVRPFKNAPRVLSRADFDRRAYAWFRLGDLDAVPVFTDDPRARELLGGVAPDSLDHRAWPPAPLEMSNVSAMEERVENQRITIKKAPIGHPLLVSVSFHHGWRARGADGPFLAGPGLMAIVPRQSEVVLEYGHTAADRAGLGLTLAVLALGLASRLGPFRRMWSWWDRRMWVGILPLVVAALAGLFLFLFQKAPEFPVLPFNRAIALFTAKDYGGAAQGFEEVLDRHGDSLIADEAAFHLAMCHYLEEDWPGAVLRLEEMLSKYPDSRRAAEIWYHIGLCLQKQGLHAQARQAYGEAIRHFPQSPWAGFSKDRLKEMPPPS